MRPLAIVYLGLGMAGCSLLFDPSGIVPPSVDLAPADAHFSVDDLSLPPVPADLSVPPDLGPPDLLTVDLRPCTPPIFTGFFDGGSPDPLDCNSCGCQLANFGKGDNTDVKFAHNINPGWSEQNDGGLTMVATAAAINTGDLYYSKGRAYLDGDFDLQLDYQIENWTVGSNLLLYVIGPNVDGGVPLDPFGYTQLYLPSAISYLLLYTDDRYLDVISNTLTGTMRVRRTGSTLCASVVGQEEQCHSGTSSARVYVQLYGLINSATCGPACNFRVRLSNLRLEHGLVVSAP